MVDALTGSFLDTSFICYIFLLKKKKKTVILADFNCQNSTIIDASESSDYIIILIP